MYGSTINIDKKQKNKYHWRKKSNDTGYWNKVQTLKRN